MSRRTWHYQPDHFECQAAPPANLPDAPFRVAHRTPLIFTYHGRPTNDNVIIRFAAGCHSCCLLPDRLNQEEPLRAVLGMTDISARPHVPADVLSFTVPWPMLLEMEGNVRGSFLDRKDWQKVKARL